jgi:hypothetical protein
MHVYINSMLVQKYSKIKKICVIYDWHIHIKIRALTIVFSIKI